MSDIIGINKPFSRVNNECSLDFREMSRTESFEISFVRNGGKTLLMSNDILAGCQEISNVIAEPKYHL